VRSRLQRDRARRPDRRALHALYRRLLRIRRDEPALRPGAARYTVHGGVDTTWVALELHTPGAADLLAVFNLGERQEVWLPPSPYDWTLRLSTDSRRYGGAGHEPPCERTESGLRIDAPGWSALLYRHGAMA